MPKCDLCDKSITKRSPGLECSKCSKVVHASQVCSGLPAKQLAAIRNSDNLGWACEECNLISPKSKSIIMPDEDEEDDITVGINDHNRGSIDVKKLLRDISSEVKSIVRKENESLEESLNYFGKKLDELGGMFEALKGRMDDLEKKQTYIVNKNIHLETKVSALEVQVRKMEQTSLDKMVEITGIHKSNNEDIKTITCNVAKLLLVNEVDIKTVRRIEGRPGSDGRLLVELENAERAASWALASKKETSPILAEHVVPCIQREAAKTRVVVRRALSKANKTLLWNAQQKLRPVFKYVWFQAGKVLARKREGDKPIPIWCEADLTQIK